MLVLLREYGKQVGSLGQKKQDYHLSEENINGGRKALWLLNLWPNGLY